MRKMKLQLQTEGTGVKNFLRSGAPYFILVAITFLVYLNTLPNDFVWDDEVLIVNNHLIGSWRNVPSLFAQSRFHLKEQGILGSGYYRPLISLSCVIDHSIWKLRPAGFHLTNILVHCLNVLLFFVFFRQFLQNRKAALLAALLYGVSPVHTNAVSYIMGRTDLFASLFFLSSLLMYQKFRRAGETGKLRFPTGSLIFFCLSLLCKESAVTLPLIVVLYDICFIDLFRRKGLMRNALITYLPFALILVGYFCIRRLVVPEGFDFAIHSFSDLVYRLATVATILVSYGKLLLFPVNLSYERGVEVLHSLISLQFLFSLALLGACLVLMFRWWNSDRGKFFCSMWFFITFAPTSNLMPVFPSIASSSLYTSEHFMYLPSMGFFIVAVSLVEIARNRIGPAQGVRWKHKLYFIVALLIALEFCVLTMRRNTDWRNSLSFYKSSLAANPNSSRAMNNLGIYYLEHKQYEKALQLFESALAVNPGNASAYNNLATIYEDHARMDRAAEMYRKAISLDERNIRARLGLGRILVQSGRTGEARKEFALLAGWYPDLSVAQHELGRILAAEGRLAEALEKFERALPGSPSPDVVLNSIGIVYARQNKREQASRYFMKAIEANPDSCQAHVNLGNIYFEQNLQEKALAEYEKALSGGLKLPAIEDRVRQLRRGSGS